MNLTNYITFYKSRSYYFSLTENQNNGCYSLKTDNFNQDSHLKCPLKKDINLKGEHNYANAMSVVIAAKIMGLDNKKIIDALGISRELNIDWNSSGKLTVLNS